MVLFKCSKALMAFSLVVLSINPRGMLKSPSIIVSNVLILSVLSVFASDILRLSHYVHSHSGLLRLRDILTPSALRNVPFYRIVPFCLLYLQFVELLVCVDLVFIKLGKTSAINSSKSSSTHPLLQHYSYTYHRPLATTPHVTSNLFICIPVLFFPCASSWIVSIAIFSIH